MTDQFLWFPRSNEQLQQQLEYTLIKLDCHGWGISKMQSGHEAILEERYTIQFCFKLGKNATETYAMFQTAFWPSCMNWASVFEWYKRFKESRESVRDDERCERSKEVRTPELIGQRGRGRATMLRFKGVEEEIQSEEASTQTPVRNHQFTLVWKTLSCGTWNWRLCQLWLVLLPQ